MFVGLVWWTAKFLETTLETVYDSEMNIQFTGGHSYSQDANSITTSKLDICGIVLYDKIAHFRASFYRDQPEGTLVL